MPAKPWRPYAVPARDSALNTSPGADGSTAAMTSGSEGATPAPAAAPAAEAPNAKRHVAQTAFHAAPAIATTLSASVFFSAPWQCVQYFVCISHVSKSFAWSRSMGGMASPAGPDHGIGPLRPNHW